MSEKPYRVVSATLPTHTLGECRTLAEAEAMAYSLRTLISNPTKVQIRMPDGWADVESDSRERPA